MSKNLILALIPHVLWLCLVQGSTITCPSLSCDDTLDDEAGYLHDALQPTVNLKGYGCNSTSKMCNMDLTSDAWAWIQEENQARTSGSSGQSIVEDRKTKGFCFDFSFYQNNLNNGRECLANYQGVSTVCDNGLGAGQSSGTVCGSHADGDNDLYGK